jgi:hypothetical protein
MDEILTPAVHPAAFCRAKNANTASENDTLLEEMV